MRIVALGDLLAPAKPSRAGVHHYPVLSMTMHSGLVEQTSRFKKRIASSDVSEYKVVHRGQLVVGFPINEGVLDFQGRHDAAIVSPAYGIWGVRDEQSVDRRYLKRFLTSPRAIEYYTAKMKGSTARRRSLPLGEFTSMPIPLPEVAEQRRIAAILDHADALRAKRRQVLAHLDTLARATFFATFGAPQEWSRMWPMVTIGDLAVSVTYGTSGKAGAAGEWPILRMGNVTDDGRVDLRDLKYIDLTAAEVPKYTVQRGDMLFNRTNSRVKVGKSAVVRTDDSLALAGYLVRVRFESSAVAEFVSGYLTSGHGLAVRQRLAKAAVNQANISASEMRSIAIARPPAASMARYEESVAAIERQRGSVLEAEATDTGLFASLQSRAFRGEL